MERSNHRPTWKDVHVSHVMVANWHVPNEDNEEMVNDSYHHETIIYYLITVLQIREYEL